MVQIQKQSSSTTLVQKGANMVQGARLLGADMPWNKARGEMFRQAGGPFTVHGKVSRSSSQCIISGNWGITG